MTMQSQLMSRQGKEVVIQTVVGQVGQVTVVRAHDTEVVVVQHADGLEEVLAYRHIVSVRDLY